MKRVLQESARMKKMIEENFKNITVLGPIDPAMPKRNLFTKELILKISGWNEQKHLKLMDVIPDMWTVIIE